MRNDINPLLMRLEVKQGSEAYDYHSLFFKNYVFKNNSGNNMIFINKAIHIQKYL